MAKQSVRDLCVSAPTGSGKTISYVGMLHLFSHESVPIVDALLPRIIPRIRALVIVPTRELASQVKKTFESFVKGTNLRVGVVTGQTSFSAEQAQLVSSDTGDVFSEGDASSKIDILVCTLALIWIDRHTWEIIGAFKLDKRIHASTLVILGD